MLESRWDSEVARPEHVGNDKASRVSVLGQGEQAKAWTPNWNSRPRFGCRLLRRALLLWRFQNPQGFDRLRFLVMPL